MIFLDDLKAICPQASSGRLAIFVDPLNDAMHEFEIDNLEREAAFLAQVAHESGSFNYVREIASGAAYEGRHDLGNIIDGDGIKYKGRGLIQVTGRANYRACSDALGFNFVDHPEWLEEPIHAARSAAWFWASRGLNEIADKGDFKLITRKINGGLNGYHDRLSYWTRAQEVLA